MSFNYLKVVLWRKCYRSPELKNRAGKGYCKDHKIVVSKIVVSKIVVSKIVVNNSRPVLQCL
jgi:hypothetical protein